MNNIFFILVDWLMLAFFSVFIFENVKFMNEGGTAYSLLVVVIALSSLIFFSRSYLSSRLVFKRSIFVLIAFFIYVLMQTVINLGTIEDIKRFTVGTSGGIVFAFILGLSINLIIYDIFSRALKSKLSNKVNFVSAAIFFIIVTLLIEDVALTFKNDLRYDIFLIVQSQGMYQRPANFISIYFMVVSFLFILLFILHCKNKFHLSRILLIIIFLLYFVSAVMLMVFSQMLGSNMAFVFVLMFLIVVLISVFLASNKKLRKWLDSDKRIKLSLRDLIKINIKLFYSAVLVCCTLLVVLFVVIRVSGFDLIKMRIFNFGLQDTLISTSISSRWGFFHNFITHFSYNPLFGNINVDDLTTGTGTYSHSLLFSLLSHTGLFGFLLFVTYLYFIFGDLRSALLKKSQQYFYFASPSINIFRILGLTMIVILASLSTFFTWMPVWFSFGLFAHHIVFGGLYTKLS